MNPWSLIPLLFCFLNLWFFSAVFSRKSKKTLDWSYLALNLLTNLWCFGNFLLWARISENWVSTVITLQAFCWLAVPLAGLSFFYHLLKRPKDRFFLFFLLIYFSVCGLLVYTDKMIAGFRATPMETFIINAGDWFVPCVIASVAFPIAYGITLVTKILRQNKSFHFRKPVRLMNWGISILSVTVFISTFFSMILKTVNLDLNPLLISLFSFYSFWIGKKYRLLSLEIEEISEEIFQNTSLGIVLLGKDLRILNFNVQALSGLGDDFLKKDQIWENRFWSDSDQWTVSDYPLLFSRIELKNQEEFLGWLVFIKDISHEERLKKNLQVSERKTLAILSAFPDLIFVLDRKGNFIPGGTSQNEHLLYPPEVFLYQNVRDLFPEEICAPIFLALERCFQTRQIQSFRYTLPVPFPEGAKHFYEARLIAFSENECIAIVRDITPEQEARLALEKSEQRFREMALNLPIALTETTISGEILFANQWGLQLFGYSQEECRKLNIYDLFPKEEKPKAKNNLTRNLSGKKPDSELTVYHFQKKDGTIFSAIGIGIPIKKDGKQTGIWFAAMDISEMERIQQALAKSHEELRQFAYLSSHDLREPLFMVTNFLQLLKYQYQEKLDEKGLRYIDFAVNGAKRMDHLIQALCHFSASEREKKPFQRVDLNQILEDVKEDLQITIHELKASLVSEKLPLVSGDAALLRQVIQNLIHNALRYHQAETAPEIHVKVQGEPTHWKISIRDNGPGIEPSKLETIFDLLTHFHSTQREEKKGIGLPLSRKIIEAHGGMLWAESNPGKGSIFYFTLLKGTSLAENLETQPKI